MPSAAWPVPQRRAGLGRNGRQEGDSGSGGAWPRRMAAFAFARPHRFGSDERCRLWVFGKMLPRHTLELRASIAVRASAARDRRGIGAGGGAEARDHRNEVDELLSGKPLLAAEIAGPLAADLPSGGCCGGPAPHRTAPHRTAANGDITRCLADVRAPGPVPAIGPAGYRARSERLALPQRQRTSCEPRCAEGIGTPATGYNE